MAFPTLCSESGPYKYKKAAQLPICPAHSLLADERSTLACRVKLTMHDTYHTIPFCCSSFLRFSPPPRPLSEARGAIFQEGRVCKSKTSLGCEEADVPSLHALPTCMSAQSELTLEASSRERLEMGLYMATQSCWNFFLM